MRCRRITFEGYRRLAETECDVNPTLLAFVGQNESGKSSVLSGLEWLTEDDETPQADSDKTRGKKKKDGWVVGAYFTLDDDEIALLKPLGFKEVPKTLTLWKQVDGRLHLALWDPRGPKRDPSSFDTARSSLDSAKNRLRAQINRIDAEDGDGPAIWLPKVEEALLDPDLEWDDATISAAEALAGWLNEVPAGNKRPRDAKTARLLREASSIGTSAHPKDAGIEVLRDRVPQFVLFRDEDRALPTVTAIDTANLPAIKPAIRNLLKVAGISPAALWAANSAGDTGEVQTILGNGNERLDAFFMQAWNQSNVTVRLNVDANGLQTHVYEIDSKRFTRLEERSDGLRAFVALAAFLEAQDLPVPPILLIDEAETHLHFDAQADLVGALLKQVNATQIYYSTHSPGCLPSDLGTGIRLLRRNGESSEIRSHFWTNEEPGFASLLFAMGAGAAAFSVCRWAVLSEGASDMIMLPTLIRSATRLADVPYQVAPGLANARRYDMRVEEVAAKVVYLTDGDDDGARYRKDLVEAGVPAARVFQLPNGMGTEDLLDTKFFLSIIAKMLPEGSPVPTADIATDGKTITLALKHWATSQSPSIDLPGKVAIAYRVVEHQGIKLKPEAKRVLVALHKRFVKALEAPPSS